jgi:hypothetical protein
METLKARKTIPIESLLNHNYIDADVYYLDLFGKIASRYIISDMDKEQVIKQIKIHFADDILNDFYSHEYDTSTKKYVVYHALFELKNEIVIKINYHSVQILTELKNEAWVQSFTKILAKCKRKSRKTQFEINLITQEMNSLELQEIEINRTKINLDLFYENDFLAVHKTIQKRLSSNKDKGLVLLHGLPGTGKTTYIRYLIGQITKKVLFLTPNLAEQITNPDFINLLIRNPNSVLIIEDAENILLDRNRGGGSGVSNLLNLSDGLLADCLNVQLVCTFNSSLSKIDEALLRKGRLIAQYEFKALSVAKAQRLSEHFGYDTIIDKPMTVSDVINQNEKDYKTAEKPKIGFRTADLV